MKVVKIYLYFAHTQGHTKLHNDRKYTCISLSKNKLDGHIVYRLRTENLRFVAPMPEQVGTPTMHFPDVRKCIVVVAICSGMGAANFIFMASTDFSR